MENKNGITLVALVITIIVLLILAGVSLTLVLGENGIVTKSIKSKFLHDVAQFKEELEMSVDAEEVKEKRNRATKINVYRSDYDKNSFISEIKKYIPSFNNNYSEKFEIIEDQLVYIGNNELEKNWSKTLKIELGLVLKINYLDQKGDEIEEPYIENKIKGSRYYVISPTISTFTPIYDVVEGILEENTEINVNYYDNTTNLTLKTVNGNELALYNMTNFKEKNVVIPEEQNGKKITQISEKAFYNNKYIETIVIPKNIETIGKSSFTGCTNLKTIVIYSENLGNIEEENFLQCKSLEEYVVNKDNNAYKVIDGILFSKDETQIIRYPQGKQDEEYTIPSSVTEICTRAIDQQQYLKKLVVPNTVKTIGLYVAALYPKLETLIINAETINNTGSFCDNYYISELEIGHDVKELTGSDCLRKCGQQIGRNLTIKYDGTIEEWKKIKKTSSWKSSSKITAVQCTDGTTTP